MQLICKSIEAEEPPKCHQVVISPEEEIELDAEHHFSSFSVDFDEDDELDWDDESSKEATAGSSANIDEVGNSDGILCIFQLSCKY